MITLTHPILISELKEKDTFCFMKDVSSNQFDNTVPRYEYQKAVGGGRHQFVLLDQDKNWRGHPKISATEPVLVYKL